MIDMALGIEWNEFLDFSVTFFRQHLALVACKYVFAHENREAWDVVIRPIGTLGTRGHPFAVIMLSNLLNILLLVDVWNIGWLYNFIISGFRALVSLMVRFLTFQIIIQLQGFLFLHRFPHLIFGFLLLSFGLGKLHFDLVSIWFVIDII